MYSEVSMKLSKVDEAKKVIAKLDKAYLKSPTSVQHILSDAYGIYLSLLDVKTLLGLI
jgi:hypothetical protein